MKKNKVLIILLIIVVIYALIMFFFFSKNVANNTSNNEVELNTNNVDTNTSTKTRYLVLNNIANLKFTSSWFVANTEEIENSSNRFKVYANNSYLGEYKLKYGNVWNLFDNNNNFVSYNGNMLAYSNNANINLKKYSVSTLTDDDKKLLKDNYNISNFDYLYTNEVINYDFDNNGILDKIICLSNIGNDLNEMANFYSIVVVILNNNKMVVINENNENSSLNKVYSVLTYFTMDGNIDYLVLKYTTGYESEVSNNGVLVYQYINNDFQKVY